MTATGTMIITRRGTVLPLDQRRRDALANYAEACAAEAGIPLQTWVRKTWGFKDYEAKDLIKGNASEPMWERIVKMKGHPHGGWRVVLPIMGAVIGEDFDDFLASEKTRLRHERRSFEAQHQRLVEMASHLRSDRRVGRPRPGELHPEPARARREYGR